MRAVEDTEMATEITPPLNPLTLSLPNSHLRTHCSACFSLLPPSPIIILSNPPSPFLYCSPPCSAAHNPAADSSDLCAALGLLLSHLPAASGQVTGLLSNRHKLTWHNRSNDDEEDKVSEKVRVGAAALAAAITELQRKRKPKDAVLEEATVELCAVLTTAVEVQDKEGGALGIAVFGATFSWIDHSCSPNACYRFIFSSPSSSPHSQKSKLRIAPFIQSSHESQQVLHLLTSCDFSYFSAIICFYSFLRWELCFFADR